MLALLAFKPMHGYQLRRIIELRGMDRWANIRYGSIYAGLRQLTKEGLLEEAGSERDGNRPPRTIYQTTQAGKEEMLRLLRQAWVEPAYAARPVDVALSFVWMLPQDEIVGLLEERLAKLEAGARELEASWEQVPEWSSGVGTMISDLFDHNRRLLAAETEWTRQVLERARKGEYAVIEDELMRRKEKDAEA